MKPQRHKLDSAAQAKILRAIEDAAKKNSSADFDAIKVVLRALWQVSDKNGQADIERLVARWGAAPPHKPDPKHIRRQANALRDDALARQPSAFHERRGYEMSARAVAEHSIVRSRMNHKIYE